MIARRYLVTGILLVTVLVGTVPTLTMAKSATSQPAQEGNLLQNPSFEGITCKTGSIPPECLDNWTHEIHWTDLGERGNIFTPQGWVIWWRRDGDYGQPEVLVIPNMPPYTGELPRVRSGHYAIKYFNYYRLQDGGLYQVVTGLQPGSTVQFSIWAHGWSCNNDVRQGYSCDDPYNQTFQVGIEPNGVADPFSPSVVWSGEQIMPDHYGLIGPITAQVGASGSVTVITRSKSKWAFIHLDAYWDDASLVVTAAGTAPTNTPPPPPAVVAPPAAPAAPRATSTPYPDGSITYIVRSGDTLSTIALMYGVSVDQIRQLNAGSVDNDIIVPGQELVIFPPTLAPTATPAPAVAEAPADAAPAPPATTGVSVCALAFHDRNSNGQMEDGVEELLPNAEFNLADASGTVIAQHTSDGINEPYCFTGLAAGTYYVIQDSPVGYIPTNSAEQPVSLPDGTSIELRFGNARGESPEAEETAPTVSEEESTSGGASSFLSVLAKVSGALILILAAGMAVLFVVNRQRI